MPNVTPDSIIATGYYRLGLYDDEPADRELARFDELDDIVATTSQAVLGLTVNCARCHDHKIDPIPQCLTTSSWPSFRTSSQTPVADRTSRRQFSRATIRSRPSARQPPNWKLQRGSSQLTKIEAEVSDAIARHKVSTNDPLRHADIDNLEYRFYRDSWDRLPDFANLKAETTGTIPSGLFDISLSTRNSAFGFVFQGTLIVPQAGKYTFYLDSDDGSRLRVNGEIAQLNTTHLWR